MCVKIIDSWASIDAGTTYIGYRNDMILNVSGADCQMLCHGCFSLKARQVKREPAYYLLKKRKMRMLSCHDLHRP